MEQLLFWKHMSTVFLVCPCNIPWNGNQYQIKGNTSISNQEGILKFNCSHDFNMHLLHSEVKTIMYTDQICNLTLY